MNEHWREIPGFPSYEVSDRGSVRSVDRIALHRDGSQTFRRGVVLKLSVAGGYPSVSLWANGKSYTRNVHRLMGLAWLPNPLGLPVVRHRDDIPTHNSLDNLAWGTYSDNATDRVTNGNNSRASTTHCPADHPYSPENTKIDTVSGARRCRICREAQVRRAAEKYRKKMKMQAAMGPDVKEVTP